MPTTTPPHINHLHSITLHPEHARELIILLIDIHGLLDHLHQDGADPDLTATANAYLRDTDSRHTLPSLIHTIDSHAYQLTAAMHHAAALTEPRF